MSTDQQNQHQATKPPVRYWHAIKEGYRTLNTVTHHAVGFLIKLAVVLYFLFSALFLGLRYLVLPNIAEYKPDVERIATRVLGNKVSIATINASWHGLRPHLTLTDVAIYDKNGKEALSLPKVAATVSWWSVTAADLRLHTLEIERPEMDVLRDAADHLYVAGIFIDTEKRGNGKGADWVLSQREIVIHDGRIHWRDEKRAAPELTMDNVNFVLRNRWRNHEFVLQATPPAALSAPLDVRGAFEHPHFTRSISNAALWKGELYVDLHDTDLIAWKPYFDYPIDIREGKGSVRAWLNLDHARLANFTADLMLSQVSTQLRSDLDPLNLDEVNGRVSMREEFNPDVENDAPTFGVNGHAVSLTDFSLRTSDGLVLPTTTISERFIPPKNGQPANTEIAAKVLDLETLADFTERLPLPAEYHEMLAEIAPRGKLKDFSAQWQGTYPAISHYRIKGDFAGLSFNPQEARAARPRVGNQPAKAAVPAIPGVRNLTGQIDASERGGIFSIASKQLVLEMPRYMAEPAMPFDSLNMQANWTFQPNDQLLLEVRKMDFVQDGLSASVTGKHLMPLNRKQGKSSGVIDMSAKLNGFRLDTIGRYLPTQTPGALRAWLTGALVAGTAHDVNLRLRGDLAHFPFSAAGQKSKGEFSVTGKIHDGTLNYAPGRLAKNGSAPLWPLLENIQGSFAFNRSSMEIRAESATTHGVGLSNVTANITDLGAPDKVLAVNGRALGPLQEFVQYVNDSPVTEWIAHFTEETKATGNAQLNLKLELPLADMHESSVDGTLQFLNNNVTLQNALPLFYGTNGKLQFHEKGFNLAGVKTNFLGGPLSLAGGSQRDGSILVKADGSLSADGIRKAYSAPAVQRAAERITGSTRYATTIRVRNKHPEILVESNMQGIALDFPAPLRKAAGESMPLKFELNGSPTNNASLLRDEIKMSLGSAVAALYERERAAEKDVSWRVVRGGIGINVPAPRPDSGVIANVDLKSLNLDEWKEVVASIMPAKQPKRSDSAAPETAGMSSAAQYIEPQMVAVKAAELIVMKRKLENVVVGASHQKGAWQANVDSEQASGYVTWNESDPERELGKVTARLARLIIPKSAVSDVTELLENKDATTQMPALDIIADNFQLFDKKFGRLELTANNARTTAGNEWQINKLSIANPDGELKASGKWTSKDGNSLSNLAYTFNIANAGRLLDRFGFPNVLHGGRGKLEGQVSWKGLPFSLDVPSLSGDLKLNMESGQFMKVDPAAAKLLGVLSLQSLPRRLVLDFRDVFSEGFAFDGVTATATISQGVVKTDNFKMRSVAATVLMDGSADIAREAQQLHVVVIPEINVGAASVVYGLAVNPVIGVGTFLAQLFLREPLMRAFTFEYQITGPWKEPVVTKLARKPVDTPRDVTDNTVRGG